MIVETLQSELPTLQDLERHYEMAEQYRAQFAQTVMVPLVGGSAAGKNTIMDAVTKIDPEFSNVNNQTTRDPAERDAPGTYTYYNHERNQRELIRMIYSRAVAQFALFPRTNDIYATLPSDYETDFCMKDVVTNGIEVFRSMPFKRVLIFSVVPDPDEFMDRFNQRWPDKTPERESRLVQTIESNQWSLQQHTIGAPDHFWLPNIAEPEVAAQALIAVARGNVAYSPDCSDLARKTIEVARLALAA